MNVIDWHGQSMATDAQVQDLEARLVNDSVRSLQCQWQFLQFFSCVFSCIFSLVHDLTIYDMYRTRSHAHMIHIHALTHCSSVISLCILLLSTRRDASIVRFGAVFLVFVFNAIIRSRPPCCCTNVP